MTVTSGSVAGSLATSTVYNGLGAMTEINLSNTLRTTFGYYGAGGSYDTTGGYYGRLWQIRTFKTPGGTPVLQDVKYTWDAGGNLTQRQDVLVPETESFTYDTLDRLLTAGISGGYSESYSYNRLGNMTSKNGSAYSYSYSARPHAVTAVGSTSYSYDGNGNMTGRGSQTITWDVENRPVTVTGGAGFVYDGDGKRGKKTEGGSTTLYVNRYYEKTGSEVTTNYHLGEKLVAVRQGTTLKYVHQDHLTGTAVMTDTLGASLGSIKFYPYGSTRSGDVPTDRKFTGQRLDATGLYYYNARYYDPSIGRFISPDAIVPDYRNPQALNRYSYVTNNPLTYVDPTGRTRDVPDPPPPIRVIEDPPYWPDFPALTPLTPFPDAGDVVTFTRSERFRVYRAGIANNPGLPLGHGSTFIRGTAAYKGGRVTVDLSILTGYQNMPPGRTVQYSAVVTVGASQYELYLDESTGPMLVPYYPGGYTIVTGTVDVPGVSGSQPVTLDINPSSRNSPADWGEPPFALVEPWTWLVDLRTGVVSTRHFWWDR